MRRLLRLDIDQDQGGRAGPKLSCPTKSVRCEAIAMDPRLRDEILSILDRASDMTIATIPQDGYPQATTVSFANDGLDIYFGCSEVSQKAWNISRNGKVSLTI